MALKNYTSGVPASRSIAWIEAKLAGCGATQILKMYDLTARVEGIAFIMPINGKEMSFKLPARVDECEVVLRAAVKRPRADTLKRIGQQAERTAWKIVADWVDAQMAMIDLSQVEFMQIFMPYLYSHAKKQTYFEIVKGRGFQKLLPEAVVEKSAEGGK